MNSDLIIPLINEVVREKNVHEDDVFYAIEHALLNLAKDRYGFGELSVKIDRNTGDISLLQHCTVIADDEKPNANQIVLSKAKKIDPEAQLNDIVAMKLPFEDFHRVGVHTSINLLYKKLEELRRIREYSEFSHRVGEIASCIVKQTFSDGQIIVNIGKGIGVLYRNDLLPSEINKYKPGDSIKAFIKDVSSTSKYQILLSRTHNQFLVKLLTLQVPELESGEVVVKKIVREPSRRAKVAVYSDNPTLDPIKVCVGQSGRRIEPVIEELKGERIDVIQWSEDVIPFAIQALKPASVQQVIFRANNLILIVPDDQKKKAIGEHGNNIKLASAITGANLSVLTEAEAVDRKKELETFFEQALDVDASISELLVSKGFETIHDLNHTDVADLALATEIEDELAAEIKDRAIRYTEETRAFLESMKDIDKNMIEIPGLKTPYMRILYNHGIKNLNDLSAANPEAIKTMLAEYKVTALSIDRFISYARKRTGKLKHIQHNPLKPDRRFERGDRSERGDRPERTDRSDGGYRNRR